MSDSSTAAVILIAAPGPLRDALLALLRSLPQIGAVVTVNRPVEALQVLATYQPALIIIVPEEQQYWTSLHEVRAAARGSRVVLLANGEQEAGNADLVLQQGARPETLVAALVALLQS